MDYSVYEDQIRRMVDKQVIGQEVREPEGVYLVHKLGTADEPEQCSPMLRHPSRKAFFRKLVFATCAVANDCQVIQNPPFDAVGIAPIVSAERRADIPDVTP